MISELGPLEPAGGEDDWTSAGERPALFCEVDLVQEDYRAWHRYAIRHRRRGWTFWGSVAAMVGTWGAAGLSIPGAPITAVLAIVAGLGTVIMQYPPVFTGPCRYVATSEDLARESEHVVTRFGWPAFSRTAETAEHFFLIRSNDALIVPKRGFAFPGDVDKFRALLSSSIAAG